MQYRDQSLVRHTRPVAREDPHSLQNEARNALRFLRRRASLLVIGALIGAALLGGYGLVSKPTYRAAVTIALDPNALAVLDTAEERAHKQDTPLQDSARVDSLVQVLQSDAALRRVVDKLRLKDDPELNGTQPSPLKAAIAWGTSLVAGAAPPPSDADRIERALDALGTNQSVERAAGTYIVAVAMLSKDPAKAATIANAFADDYLDEQLRNDIDTTRAAADWMKTRLAVLREQMLQTQGAVADFKRAHAIATVDGKSLADQTLSDVSTKLSDAMGQTAQVKAKLDRIVQVNAQTTLDLSVADALSDDVITDLRKKYLDLQGRAANIAAQYGQSHAAVLKLRSEADVVMTSIRNELRRLEEVSRSDYEIALRNEQATRDTLHDQFVRTTDVGRDEVRLQELESTGTTAQLAYEESLKRYTETVQKESFPMVQARIIARALPPNEAFKPKLALLVALGAAGGLFACLAYALVAGLFDRRIASPRHLERVTGVACLGIVPLLKPRAFRRAATFRATAATARRRDLPWDYVVQAPRSVGAEALRSVKHAFDLAHHREGERVLGITSSLAGEGKSTIAANIAHLISHGGARVLLIDADLRRSTLSALLSPAARVGLPDVLSGHPYRSAIVTDKAIGIDFLPATTGRAVAHPDQLLGSESMRVLLATAGKAYDYVIVDLPPLLPVVDVRSVAGFIDGFVVVAAWGRTDEDVLVAALDTLRAAHDAPLGIVLNKVRVGQLARLGEAAPTHLSLAYHSG